jgi:hypothetical protein
MIKAPKKLGIEGSYLNILKPHITNIASTILNRKKAESIPLKSGMRQE